MTLCFLVIGLLYFRHCTCCPTGYTFCANENNQCSATGVIAYGQGTSYTYKIPLSTPFTCNNNEFGDPLQTIAKECCSQNPTISGIKSPIIDTISCGDTKNINWRSPSDNKHFFKLTTTRFLDITFSTCQSGFDTRLHVFNAAGNIFSNDYCPGGTKDGDDCGSCGNNEIFTIPSLLPDTYYIRVKGYNDNSYGDYQLSVTCTENDFGFRHLGCYGDGTTPRAMSYNAGTGHTIKSCYETCKAANYLYFAVQYRYECFCSNNYADSTQYGPSTLCSATCGNTAYVNACEFPGTGGDYANDLYKINTLSPTKTPTTTPTTSRPTTTQPTTGQPTIYPTSQPTTGQPTVIPTINPSTSPSKYPSNIPTNIPTETPTNRPSEIPTNVPSVSPTEMTLKTSMVTQQKQKQVGVSGETSGLDDIILILIILISVFTFCIIVVLICYFYRKRKKQQDTIAKFGVDTSNNGIELGATSPNSDGDGNMHTNPSANLARVQSMSSTSMMSDNMSPEMKQSEMNANGMNMNMGSFNENNMMNENDMNMGSFQNNMIMNNPMMNNPMMNMPIQLYNANGGFNGNMTQEQMAQMSNDMNVMAASMNVDMSMLQQNFGINPNMAQFYMNQMNTANNGENASSQPGADPNYKPNIQNTAGGFPNMMPLPVQVNNLKQ